jgi:hypothetical protein
MPGTLDSLTQCVFFFLTQQVLSGILSPVLGVSVLTRFARPFWFRPAPRLLRSCLQLQLGVLR